MKRHFTSLRVALGLFFGLMSLTTFLWGFFLWLSVDEFIILGSPGFALVLMIPVSTALYLASSKLLTRSFKQQVTQKIRSG